VYYVGFNNLNASDSNTGDKNLPREIVL
jgi:hypothetical protein